MTDPTTLPYRPCAGVMLLNREGKVFVGQRLDSTVEAWQMPQGGIDDGEAPQDAALRELGEEIGVAPDKVELIASAPEEIFYDLPPELVVLRRTEFRGTRGAKLCGVEFHVCQEIGDRQGMDEVGLPRMAHLSPVLERREHVGPAKQLDVGVRAVRPHFFEEILEANHGFRCLTPCSIFGPFA